MKIANWKKLVRPYQKHGLMPGKRPNRPHVSLCDDSLSIWKEWSDGKRRLRLVIDKDGKRSLTQSDRNRAPQLSVSWDASGQILRHWAKQDNKRPFNPRTAGPRPGAYLPG